jgi:DNA polymerase III delta prime subunit
MISTEIFSSLLVEKYRPKSLDDIVLSKDDRDYFTSLVSKEEVPHLLFSGSPGTGKTSLAKILVNDILQCQYLYINASDENGIDTIRTKVIGFSQTKSFDGKLKVVLFDECDALSIEGQKALRNVIEEYSSNTRFIFTCNYLFKIMDALRSRCQIFNLVPPLDKVTARVVHILRSENINVPDDEKTKLLELIRTGYPDMRRIINDVQKYSHTGTLLIKSSNTKNLAEKIIQKLIKKTNLIEIRKFVIESEQNFSSDYIQLLREMFEAVYTNSQILEQKNTWLLTISEAMYKDAIVLDKEINWFSCCIKLNDHNIS